MLFNFELFDVWSKSNVKTQSKHKYGVRFRTVRILQISLIYYLYWKVYGSTVQIHSLPQMTSSKSKLIKYNHTHRAIMWYARQNTSCVYVEIYYCLDWLSSDILLYELTMAHCWAYIYCRAESFNVMTLLFMFVNKPNGKLAQF